MDDYMIILAFLIFIYEFIHILRLCLFDFNSKRQFLLGLIPFYSIIEILVDNYKSLGDNYKKLK